MINFLKKKWKTVVIAISTPVLLLGVSWFCIPLAKYLMVQGYYQARIIFLRKPMKTLLLDPSLDAETRRKLHLVEDIKKFGVSLGLQDTKSYTTVYDTGGGPVVYAVSAAPKDRLESFKWNFPIVGKVPYLGFFRREDAEQEVKKLRAKGLDTHMRPVSAYSTLGILPDPLYSGMLSGREEDLADTILHEMTHETVFIKSDMDFNESLASFTGEQAAIDFLKDRYGEGSEKLQLAADYKHDVAVFTGFITGIADELKTLYDSDRSKDEKIKARETIFAGARQKFLLIVKPRLRTKAFDRFSKARLNNAYILLFRQYHGESEIFEELYRLQGNDLKKTIEFLKSVKDTQDPRKRLQEEIQRLKNETGPI